jgi:hypothetical protein
VINELKKNKILIAAIQETRWNKLTPQAFSSNRYHIYTNCFPSGFKTEPTEVHNMNFTPINEHLCIPSVKSRFFNHCLINIHAPTNDSDGAAKDLFYGELERA